MRAAEEASPCLTSTPASSPSGSGSAPAFWGRGSASTAGKEKIRAQAVTGHKIRAWPWSSLDRDAEPPPLGINPVQHPRKRYALAHVLGAADPGDGALESEAKPSVRHGAVAAEVQIPFERLAWETVGGNPLLEGLQVVLALPASDDLTHSFGGQDVHAERQTLIRRIPLHVKGLHGAWIAMDQDRPVEAGGDGRLVSRSEIVPPFEGEPFQEEELHRLIVREAGEGGLDRLELRDVALEDLELRAAILEDVLHHRQDHALRQLHDVRQLRIGHLRLDHPELGEVAAGLGFFGPEGGPEAIHLAKCHGPRLHVELAALREVALVIEVLHFEQVGGPLAGAGSEDRRIEAH